MKSSFHSAKKYLPALTVGLALLGGPISGARADVPDSRYTVTNNGSAIGTVLDKKTQLVWQQTNDVFNGVDWDSANMYCGSPAQHGMPGSGWRLPTLKELMTLVDYSKPAPGLMINTNVFPTAQSIGYWTSSGVSISSGVDKWSVRFDYGLILGGVNERVRCVRSGP